MRILLQITFGVLLVVIQLGCGALDDVVVDRSNRLSVVNREKEPVKKVIIEWGEKEYLFDPADFKEPSFTNISKPMIISKNIDTTMKINVFYMDQVEPVVHEENLRLEVKGKRNVVVSILKDKKVSVADKKNHLK